MKSGILLGIDIGSSGVKTGLFSPVGEMKGFAVVPYRVERPWPGWAEVDPQVWWDAVVASVDVACQQGGIDRQRIISVGISTICPAVVAMDGRGQPLRPAILFMDLRSAKQAEGVQNLAPEVHSISGNRIMAGATSITSLLWMRENEPEIYAKAVTFGHGNTYLAYRLTGELGWDWTNASFSGLFDTGGLRTWSSKLCDLFEIQPGKLPPAIKSDSIIGRLTAEAAEATGIPAGVPVAMGAADTACSALGAGIVNAGEVFETAGTSDIVAFCSAEPRFDLRFLNRCHSVGNLWLLMGATSSPGGALAWLRDQFCWPEREVERATGVDAYDLMCAQAERTAPGAGKVIFLPYMSGERSPVWDPHARGVFVGFSLATTKGEIIRAVLEGGAYAVRQNAEIAEELLGRSIRELRAVGGGAKSRIWAQIRADVLGKRVRTLRFHETAVLGAAMLGGIGTGVFADYGEAVKMASPSEGDVFEPRVEVHTYYDKLYAIYRKLYPTLKGSYQLLAEVPNWGQWERESLLMGS
jgi:xylulokinase